MRLCNYRPAGSAGPLEAGFVLGSRVMPLATALGPGPLGPTRLRDALDPAAPARFGMGRALPLERVDLGPPLCPVPSFRDFSGFERDEQPVSFSNPTFMLGPDEPLVAPTHGEWLDFELELGCIIGREGRDIPVDRAEGHIAGYTVLNDWSLRDVQRQEPEPGLGLAEELATSIGPFLVTPDELEQHRAGKGYDLEMVARVNGRELSRGNWNSIHRGFAEMIARASQGVTLRPGDLLGSGTVGTGCILELGPESAGGWLEPGDVVELEVERLGLLRTKILA